MQREAQLEDVLAKLGTLSRKVQDDLSSFGPLVVNLATKKTHLVFEASTGAALHMAHLVRLGLRRVRR